MIWKKTKEEIHREISKSFSVDGIRRMLPKKEIEETPYQDNNKTQEHQVEFEKAFDANNTQKHTVESQEGVLNQEQQEGFSIAPSVIKDPRLIQIEEILSDGLGDIFYTLPDTARQEFRHNGEEAAKKILIILSGTKEKIGKVFQIIFNWLKTLPGVNRLFVEQQAKIKLDKILEWKDIPQ